MAEKVLTGMSGGVDSAVCTYLLKQQGYDVGGVNCHFYKGDAEFMKKQQIDTEDAKRTADMLGIPFYVFDFTQEFQNKVIENFINAYEQGATPNPCIVCNKHLKFDSMLERAQQTGYEKIATGHYAIIEKHGDRYLLKKGLDSTKDQSYVLYCLNQHQLSHTLLPLGGMTKEIAREIADEIGFSCAGKHDSQDICFIPDGDYASFIERYTGKAFPHGNFVNTEGRILGQHKGIIRYTVGQRKGLGLSLPAPMYVKEKNVAENTVILCDNQTLFTKQLQATNINFIPFDTLSSPIRVKAKVRYKHQEQWATVEQTGEDSFTLVFDEPQRAIAKGQSVVLYDGDYIVGGGIIE